MTISIPSKGHCSGKVHCRCLDPTDKQLASTLKVKYQGWVVFWCCIVSPKTCPVHSRICAVWNDANILQENSFLFTSLCSMDHVSGWHAVQKICKDVQDLFDSSRLFICYHKQTQSVSAVRLST